MIYDYSRRTAADYSCDFNGVSTAWIDDKGKIHLLKGSESHDSWAKKLVGEDVWTWDTNMDLFNRGFVRVTNLRVWQLTKASSAAQRSMVDWIIHCVVISREDLEKKTIMVEGRPGQMAVYSPADFVRRFGGMRAENDLFDRYYKRWPLPKAASTNHARNLMSYNYDRRTAAQEKTALRQRNLLKLLGKGGTFGVISAARPGSKQKNKIRHGELLGDLQRLGYRKWHDLRSKWEGVPEKSVMVPNISANHLFSLLRKYNQDAVIYKSRDGVVGLYYQAGYAEVAIDTNGDPAFEMGMGEDLYSKIRRDWSFELGFVWGKHIPFDGRNPIDREDARSAIFDQAA